MGFSEHLHDFFEGQAVYGRWWETEADPIDREYARQWWRGRPRAHLEEYIPFVRQACPSEITLRLGIEADYIPGCENRLGHLLDAAGPALGVGGRSADQFAAPHLSLGQGGKPRIAVVDQRAQRLPRGVRGGRLGRRLRTAAAREQKQQDGCRQRPGGRSRDQVCRREAEHRSRTNSVSTSSPKLSR